MMQKSWEKLKSVLPLLALLLLVSTSFWLAPAPQGQPDVEYWGHYQRLGPHLGFVLNHDSYDYLKAAEHPGLLLRPRAVRQSRPLYPLLGAATGYPLAAALRLGGRLGVLPALPPEHVIYYGLYGGYVLLNGLVLLASLLLLRGLVPVLAPGAAGGWPFWPLAWVLAANPVTKAFFWTAHQQMFAFLVPLLGLALAGWLRRWPAPGWPALGGLALALGLLPLVYGSFVLLWPALAFGLWRPAGPGAGAAASRWSLVGRLALSAVLFALPTLLWIGLLHLQGTTYYNHEAAQFHQFVWLWEARHLALGAFGALLLAKLGDYLGSLHLLWGWLLLSGGLYLATRQRLARNKLLPPVAGAALGWVAGSFVLFFALLGYYPERLAYTLLPLLLALLAALLPRWPRRYAQPLALAVAAGWHLYVVVSYGPFS